MSINITNSWTESGNKELNCFIFGLSMFIFLPFILFGTDSIITIHDNLDCFIPMCKMYYNNNLFLKFDASTNGFSEMSTLYYPIVTFNIQSMMYMFFNDFTAYTLLHCLSMIIGYISMYIMLKKTLDISPKISALTAICYASLPILSYWNICISILPLIIAFFFHFALRDNYMFSWKVFLLLFFPFFSSFPYIGIFILGFWLLGIVVFGIRNKKVNINLIVGLLLLCIGYILVDLRLFYVIFVLKTPLNRSIINVHSIDFIIQIKTFFIALFNYSIKGYYPAASLQKIIVLPLAIIVWFSCLITIIRKMKKKPGNFIKKVKTSWTETNVINKQLFLFFLIIFIFYIIAALFESGLLKHFLIKYFPLLTGFNWGRIWIFNRVLWYIVFALCICFVLKTNLSAFTKNEKMRYFFPRFCAGLIICLQLACIATAPVLYNDQAKTWFNEIVIKTGIAKKIFPNKSFDEFISYKEFYANDFFEGIKKEIGYTNERVVAFGFHPAVLMYNGFNCIDGYNNAYPLSYMHRFRALIAPELEINPTARDYFDSWGGRMYLYNKELDIEPTRNKNTSPVKLNIDIDVFRNDFDGKYILSRAEISNHEILGANLVNCYYNDNSIYTIYLYKAQ